MKKYIGLILIKDNSKLELLIALRQDGCGTTKKRVLKGELVLICQQRNICTTKEGTQVIDGWRGKPKGKTKVLIPGPCSAPIKVKSLNMMITTS